MQSVNTRKIRFSKAAFAALLSGLVLPGLGQVYLKRYLRGIILMTIITAGFVVVIGMAAFAAVKPLQAAIIKGGDIDMQAVVGFAVQSFLGGPLYYKAFLLWVFFLWVFAVIDAYFIGKKGATGAGE